MAACSSQLYRLALREGHKVVARKLSKLDDVRCIGRLADALEWPDMTVRHFAIAALTRLLPRVRASDNILQTPQQRANLARMLVLSNARQHADLLVGILAALQQVGDASALPAVRQLAAAQPASIRERIVCDAARDCLPYLQQRARLAQSSQTLLRASSAAETGSDTLVRPVVSLGLTDPEQLLRADTRATPR
jgi:hypothetical protein